MPRRAVRMTTRRLASSLSLRGATHRWVAGTRSAPRAQCLVRAATTVPSNQCAAANQVMIHKVVPTTKGKSDTIRAAIESI